MEPWNDSLTEDWVEPPDLQPDEDVTSESVLREQTASERNTIGRRSSKTTLETSSRHVGTPIGTIKATKPKDPALADDSLLSSNSQSLESPAEGQLLKYAPEWRRKLLEGNQTDLFSPSHLEAFSRGPPETPQLTPKISKPLPKSGKAFAARIFTGTTNDENSRFSPEISRAGWRPPAVADGSSLSIIQYRPEARGNDTSNEEMSEIVVHQPSAQKEYHEMSDEFESSIAGDSQSSSVNLKEFLDHTTRVVEIIRGERSFSMDPISLHYTSPPSFSRASASPFPPITSVILQAPSPSPKPSPKEQSSPTPQIAPTVARQPPSPFHLTTLPNFSFNQADEVSARENESALEEQDQIISRDLISTFHLATHHLVKILTDIEPYEPYWETMKEVKLKDMRLLTLHNLDRFCGKIEKLDASGNEIGQLQGLPITVRQLNISNNCLNNLTAWQHLNNLQFVDVSNNQLESLDGFAGLVHLRELRANGNKITSVNGVSQLDGLNVLKLNDNCIDSLDFAGSGLIRLAQLDLGNNRLSRIENLHGLPELLRLDLSSNRFETFEVSQATPLPKLQTLILSSNSLRQLDVSCMPEMRILEADSNLLSHVMGLKTIRHLKALSIRSQRSIQNTQPQEGLLGDCFELQRLQASNNFIPQFLPRESFLNLHNLELVQCGLRCLPADFGQRLSNLRTLNLNFNIINNVEGLRGIGRLTKLLLAGNRLQHLRKTASVLGESSQSLSELDLRGNLFNFGFVPAQNDIHVVADGLNWATALSIHAFVLPEADPDKNQVHLQRLDHRTKLQIRRYHILLGRKCGALRSLDGSTFDAESALAKDKVWKQLIDAGTLQDTPLKPQQPKFEMLGNEVLSTTARNSLDRQGDQLAQPEPSTPRHAPVVSYDTTHSVIRNAQKDTRPPASPSPTPEIQQPLDLHSTLNLTSRKRRRPSTSTVTMPSPASKTNDLGETETPVRIHAPDPAKQPENCQASEALDVERPVPQDRSHHVGDVTSTNITDHGVIFESTQLDPSISGVPHLSKFGETHSIADMSIETNTTSRLRIYSTRTNDGCISDQSSVIRGTARLRIHTKHGVSTSSRASSSIAGHHERRQRTDSTSIDREAVQSRHRQAHLSKMRASLEELVPDDSRILAVESPSGPFDSMSSSSSPSRSFDSTPSISGMESSDSYSSRSRHSPIRKPPRAGLDSNQSRLAKLHRDAVRALREGEQMERTISIAKPPKMLSHQETRRLVSIRRREVGWIADEAGIRE